MQEPNSEQLSSGTSQQVTLVAERDSEEMVSNNKSPRKRSIKNRTREFLEFSFQLDDYQIAYQYYQLPQNTSRKE